MTKRLVLTAIFEEAGNHWIQARIKEIPAVITAAPTAHEAKELLLDALREYLLSLENENGNDGVQDSATSEPIEILLGA